MARAADKPGNFLIAALPLLVFIFGATLSILLWYILHERRDAAFLAERLTPAMNRFVDELQKQTYRRTEALRSLQALPQSRTASPVVADIVHCDNILVYERNRESVQMLFSESGTMPPIPGHLITSGAESGPWHRTYRDDRSGVWHHVVGFGDGENDILICQSDLKNDFERTLSVVSDSVAVEVRRGNDVLHSHKPPDFNLATWSLVREFQMPGEIWQLKFEFDERQFGVVRARMFEISLLLFFGISVLLAVVTRFFQLRIRREAELTSANYRLEEVTSRNRQTLKELAAMRQYFDQLVENIDGAFWVFSADGSEPLFLSPGHEKIWGVPVAELRTDPQRLFTSVLPEDRESFGFSDEPSAAARLPVKRPYRASEPDGYEIEYRIRRPDGGVRWLRERAYPVAEYDAAVSRMVGLVEDVTESHRMDRALRRSESRFRRLYESNLISIFFGDRHGNIFEANEAFLGLVERNESDLPLRWADISMLESRDDDLRAAARLDEQGWTELWQTGVLRPDGSSVSVLAGAALLEESRNQIICFFIDLSPLKAAEIELQRTADELRRSNEALGEFAHIASHDLKEPLRGIHNYSRFVVEDYGSKLDQRGSEMLSRIADMAHLMEKLLDGLRAYSSLNKTGVDKTEIEVSAVVDEVRQLLHYDIESGSVDIRIPRPLPRIECDVVRLRELFFNLMVNAIKYNDKPSKWVEIGYEDTDPVTLYVRDNGIGIAERHQEKIFNIFKRLHDRDAFGGGSGAGLTIARRTVELHGGRIWVESVPEVGTTFRFTLQGEGDG